MFKHLALTRPLVVLDLETTGTNVKTDRIVEISILKSHPSGECAHRPRRVHPGIPIPPEATTIHGITDADVAAAEPFAGIVDAVLRFLHGCDLCGFNLKRFDL